MNKKIQRSKPDILVVDDNDKVIGHKSRDLVDTENLKYRVSALWIKNSKGEILLARRAYTKTHSAGKWGPAVAGTNDYGETYLSNIKKEAKEELGLENVELKEGPKIERNEEGKHRYFTQWFIAVVDKPTESFKIQHEEVAEVRWFSEAELRKQLKENPEEFLKGIWENIDLFR